MHVWVRKENVKGEVKVNLVFFLPHGVLILEWLWVNWSTYRYLCEALKLAVKTNFSTHAFRGSGCGGHCTTSENVAINQLLFPFPPCCLSLQTCVCLTPQCVCFSWGCDSGPVCGMLSPDQLPLPQRLLRWCAVAQQMNTSPWSS